MSAPTSGVREGAPSRAPRTAARERLRPLRPHEIVTSLGTSLSGWTRLDVVVVMTLVMLLLHVQGFPTVPIQAAAVAGLLFRPLSRHPAFWFAIAVVLAVGRLPFSWYTLVNHHFLMMYWLLALGLCFMAPRPDRVLALSARTLLGLVFAFATLWKLLSPDFIAGSFFEFTLITDARFEVVSSTVGGLPGDGSESNAAAISAWWDPAVQPEPVVLESGSAVPWIARLMSVWGVALEGSLAVLLLVPWRGRLAQLARLREPALLLFIMTTYPFAPVIGFAWLLLAMALAQSAWRSPSAEVVYTSLFVVLHLFEESSVLWVVSRRLTGLG